MQFFAAAYVLAVLLWSVQGGGRLWLLLMAVLGVTAWLLIHVRDRRRRQ